MNMALAVVEPCSTGLGGDCFALYYQASNKKVYGLNGSGRSSSRLTINTIKQAVKENPHLSSLPSSHALNVTVPGNVAGTIDFHAKFGTLPRKTLFEPAIDLAQRGFALSTVTAYLWHNGIPKLLGNVNDNELNFDSRNQTSYGRDLLIPNSYNDDYISRSGSNLSNSNGNGNDNGDGKDLYKYNFHAPRMGEIFRNPKIANVLRYIAQDGKSAFYDIKHKSGIARNIIEVIKLNGGVMTSEDLLNNHQSTFVEPICINYKNKVNIFEIPPNGQGIAALMALNFYQNRKLADGNKNTKNINDINATIEELHHKIECMRLSFRYSREIVCDLSYPDNQKMSNNLNYYLSKEFGRKCFNTEIFSNKINTNTLQNGGFPIDSSDTVSFAAVDKYGNACSFISSNYEGFGSGLVPRNCGFTLQNRGFNFRRDGSNHPNFVAPNKRPYHTIIPGMATYYDNNDLYAAFSVMGGWMQPQGHFQVISNMIDYGMNPQESLDRPRFCVSIPKIGELNPTVKESVVFMERGHIIGRGEEKEDDCTEKIVQGLKQKGHKIEVVQGFGRQVFGRGQIIYNDRQNGTLWGGSDGRADGCAIGLETDKEFAPVVTKYPSKLKSML